MDGKEALKFGYLVTEVFNFDWFPIFFFLTPGCCSRYSHQRLRDTQHNSTKIVELWATEGFRFAFL